MKKILTTIFSLALIFIFSNTASAEYKVAAWLVPWDNAAGFDSLERNKDYIDVVSPFWYHVNADGTLSTVTNGEDKKIIDFARANNIEIIPTISNSFDGNKIKEILNNPDEKKKNIQIIVDKVVGMKYDGIDIDYEGIKSEDIDAFTAYIRGLRAALNKYNKKLTIAIQAKTFDSLVIYGNRGQDWPELAQYVDEFRIMAYDYGWKGSIPRPVAPHYWVDDILEYAVANVPKEKIYLGVPYYGYGWSKDFFSSYTYSTILLILEKYGVDFQYDPVQKTNRLFYISNNDTRDPKIAHQVWFENHISLEAKLELAKKYGIGGIAIWRIGKEDNENWRRIRKVFYEENISVITPFKDVDKTTKYFAFIARLYDLGIIKGQGGTTNFAPYDKVNRAEILKMCMNSFAHDVSKYSFKEIMSEDFINPFTDINSDQWFFSYVQTAVEKGIVKGYSDGTFMPGRNISRVEALKMALESAGITLDYVAAAGAGTSGTVVHDPWYKPYSDWAIAHNMYDIYSFEPGEQITRAEAAYIIGKVISEAEK
ncbi:S-layer homology domain-containing protein [Candidatus Peregrinibacteria bacterium]|nr:S-layer homology domain-containing protein [Candidatus Peregrinibacteria bacterium]